MGVKCPLRRSKAKVGESAITVRELAKDCYNMNTLTQELVDPANDMWKAQLTSSPEGNVVWLKRMLGRFDSAIERFKAHRKGKAPNLRTQATQLREPRPEEAFKLCTWWGNNEEQIKAQVDDPLRYDELFAMFLRGTDQQRCFRNLCGMPCVC